MRPLRDSALRRPPGVDIAYRDGNVTIYEVDTDAACAATNVTYPPG